MFAPAYFPQTYFTGVYWPPSALEEDDNSLFIDGQRRQQPIVIEEKYGVEVPETETALESIEKALKSLDAPKGVPSKRKVKAARTALQTAINETRASALRNELETVNNTLEDANLSVEQSQALAKRLKKQIKRQQDLRDDEEAIIALLLN